MSDKHDNILKDIERKAKELRFGRLTIELKIHEGEISYGEVKEKVEGLG